MGVDYPVPTRAVMCLRGRHAASIDGLLLGCVGRRRRSRSLIQRAFAIGNGFGMHTS